MIRLMVAGAALFAAWIVWGPVSRPAAPAGTVAGASAKADGAAAHQPAPLAIAELLAAPLAHEGRVIRVSGRVIRRASLAGYGGFEIEDGQGAVLLVLTAHTPAAPGETVSVTGAFRSALTLGAFSLPVLIAREWSAGPR